MTSIYRITSDFEKVIMDTGILNSDFYINQVQASIHYLTVLMPGGCACALYNNADEMKAMVFSLRSDLDIDKKFERCVDLPMIGCGDGKL